MADTQVPYPDLGAAHFGVLDTWEQSFLLAGGDPDLESYPYVCAANQTLTLGQVVGLDGAGHIVPAVHGAIQAIGVMAVNITVGGTPTKAPVWYSGCFSIMGLNWDDSYSTQAIQEAAFIGAPTPTQITVKLRQSDIWAAP